MPSSEEAGPILRELDLFRDSVTNAIESLTAKVDSMGATLRGDFTSRLSNFEQWQTRHVAQWDKHVEEARIDTAQRAEERARLAEKLHEILTAQREGESRIGEKMMAAFEKRDLAAAAAEKARVLALELERKERATELEKINDKVKTHAFVIKIISVVSLAFVTAGVGAFFKYVSANAAAVERLERLEATLPAPATQSRHPGDRP